eukprot:scaffold11152_cov119-Isochrysis_galbana.AAC.3
MGSAPSTVTVLLLKADVGCNRPGPPPRAHIGQCPPVAGPAPTRAPGIAVPAPGLPAGFAPDDAAQPYAGALLEPLAPRAFAAALVARLGRVGLWGDHHDEVAGQHAHQAHLQRGRQAAVTRPARLRAPRAPGNGYKLLWDLHACVPGHSAEARHQPCLPPLALDVGLAPLLPPLWPSVEREAMGESLHPHRCKVVEGVHIGRARVELGQPQLCPASAGCLRIASSVERRLHSLRVAPLGPLGPPLLCGAPVPQRVGRSAVQCGDVGQHMLAGVRAEEGDLLRWQVCGRAQLPPRGPQPPRRQHRRPAARGNEFGHPHPRQIPDRAALACLRLLPGPVPEQADAYPVSCARARQQVALVHLAQVKDRALHPASLGKQLVLRPLVPALRLPLLPGPTQLLRPTLPIQRLPRSLLAAPPCGTPLPLRAPPVLNWPAGPPAPPTGLPASPPPQSVLWQPR